MQNVEKIVDHAELFRQDEYQELFTCKKAFENGHEPEAIAKQAKWTKSWEYREKNLAREALVINPTKACQPLGAVFAAQGFDGCLPLVHGSQGCVAYFRTHLSRHYKEPNSCVSSSMTEEAAVFGGHKSLIEALRNANALYQPKMIAVSTTCMAEVIGDDLSSFIATAKEEEAIPAALPTPFAHTPSFVGSHITGYDGMMQGILNYVWEREEARERQPGERINIIPGFDGYSVGNNRELKRIVNAFGIDADILGDTAEVYDTPTDGQFRMYGGGTSVETTRAALDAKATLSLQQYCTTKTLSYIKGKGQETLALNYPMGVGATDELLGELSRLSGKEVPQSLREERGRLVDAIGDSHTLLHGQRVAVFGDPDFCLGFTRFLLELGMEPVHILATNGTKKWAKQVDKLLAGSPYGKEGKVWPGKDLWHLRSLLFTEPTDYIVGSSYGKYLERDTGIPLIRLTYPVFDRHHHRFPTWGYQGGLTVLVRLLDRVLEDEDRRSSDIAETDYSFDLVR